MKGAEVTGFSNSEEAQTPYNDFTDILPFSLEDRLKELSGKYVKADQPWGEKVVVAKVAELGGPLITGQNPASAEGVGEAVVKKLKAAK